MATLYITTQQLNKLGRWKIAKNFILILRGKMHVRLDLRAFSGGGLSRPVPAVSSETVFAYQVSSFHVKVDAVRQVTVDEDPAIKTIEDWSDYLYFAYVDTGVWQPIWGYDKYAKTVGGKQGGTARNELYVDDWGALMDAGRKFIGKLGQATGSAQNMACGPIQGAQANLLRQL